jgi:hypothetical protein
MCKNKCLVFFFLFFVIVSFIFSQETTGSIKVIVTDTQNELLPGASVVISSSSLIGARDYITNQNGECFVAKLSPGKYKVVVKLEGFKTETVENIIVSLGITSIINVKMELGKIEEEIVVTAKENPVDITNSKLATNIKKDFFDLLPKGRDFKSMALLAPGVIQGKYGIGITGATGGENQFMIDGTTTTGVMRGNDNITNLVYEFIEEVQTKTGGYEAEYGGALGGVINVITKSGGNEYHGEMRLNYQSDKLYGKPKIGIYGDGAINEFNYYDLSFSLGGYLIKDKLWFFAAYAPAFRTTYYNPTNLYTHQTGRFEEKTNTNYFSLKLSYLLYKKHTIGLTAFGDPGKTEGGNPGSLRDWSSDWQARQKYGSLNIVLKYDGIFGDSLLLHFLLGKYYSNPILEPISGNKDEKQLIYDQGYLGYPEGWVTGGFGMVHQPYARSRWNIKTDITKFWGDHTFKAGIQYSRWQGENNGGYTGEYYRHYQPALDLIMEGSWTQKGTAYTDIISLFLQDSWKVSSRLYLNLGVRVEDQKLHASDPSSFFKPNETVIHFTFGQQLSPRLGFTFDVFGDGSSKLFGSYGRFFEMVPLDINLLAFGYIDSMLNFYTLSTEELLFGFPLFSKIEIADRFPGEPKMKPPYAEEFILGFQKEILPKLSLSIRGIYKRLGMYVEDGSFDGAQSYVVFNPGIHCVGDWSTDPIGFPKAKRNYRAFEIELNKSYDKNFQFYMSYTYSRLTGNMSGFGYQEYNQINANTTAQFDDPGLMYNSDGNLWNDRPHALKLNGIYTFSFGLNLGASFRFQSGQPLTKLGTNPWYGEIVYLDQRGTDGRLPNFYQLDMHLEYTCKLSDRYNIGLYFDVFNALNTKIEVARDMVYARYKFYGLGGGIEPPWEPDPQPDNEFYGKVTLYQSPISGIIGIKFQF